MKTTPFARRCAAALTAAVLAAPSAFAADSMSPEAIYKQERAACLAGNTNQSRHDCLYEAQSVLRDARSGKLRSDDPGTLAANALQRCAVQPAGDDRDACERLARGQGEVSGSVADGGVLKELVTIEPAQPAPVAPAPR